MTSKAPEETRQLLPSTDELFYIVGTNRLQNELIASCLQREMGAKCFICDTVSQLTFLDDSEPDHRVKLVLWDCRERDPESVMVELELYGSQISSQTYMVLLNIKPGLGIEEKCVWKGLRGLFYEHDPLDRFLKGVHSVLKGELWLSREIMSKCILEGRGHNDTSERENPLLTARQVEILALVAIGATNDEIADKLFISPHTVKTHLYNIFKKINVPNRLQAALWTVENLEYVMRKHYPLKQLANTLVPKKPSHF